MKLVQVHSIRNGEVVEMEQFGYDGEELITKLIEARDRAIARGPWDDIRAVKEADPAFILVGPPQRAE